MKKPLSSSSKNVRKKAPAREKPANAKADPSMEAEPTPESHGFPIVGVGASAGGYEAFSEMLKTLPENTGMAFVFVQHLDPTHGSVLTEILSRTAKIPAVEVKDGMKVEPDHLYVIPANTTMLLNDGELRLGARTLVRGQHLPIDQFFNSLAEERGNQAIGVILSGTASDGTEGCRAIKAFGGITFAQDDSAKFSSMPRSAISAGCVDFVLSPREITRELSRIGRHPYIAGQRLKDEQALTPGAGNEFNELLALVREASGVDFGLYKQTTLQRRIKRRMVVHRLEQVKDYLRYVRDNPGELDELYRDILIHVTGFFRDTNAYEALQERVFPALVQSRKLEENPIRIWIPGCSTGEEAYSIAICLLEFLWQKARTSFPGAISTKAAQIFATDISDVALDRARIGLYTDAAVSEVSPERLSRFFLRLDGGYQINKSIREMCIFARQNVTKDPPFPNLDLITCRNLLIYLGPELQKRVIPTLHYALKPDGFLMLGGSESLGMFSDHFLLIDKKYKIYQKKRSAARLITYFTGTDYAIRRPETARTTPQPPSSLTIEKEIERLLVNRFVPASIVVNDQMEIVQFRGRTGAYLEPAAGHPTFSLSKMAREGLLVDLRAALNKAKKTNTTARAEAVRVKTNGHTREVDLEIIPVRGQNGAERFYIVVFGEPGQKAVSERPERGKHEQKSYERPHVARENDRLKREVQQLREQLQSLIEDHETTSEEFKSANEEVLSANEELQSTNEELETAKEELQSSNEELTTLNEELQNRNTELSLANNDLINLLGNVNIPVVMVGNDLRIRRFTPPAQKLLNLIPADIGRRLSEVRPNLDVDDIETSVQATIDTATLHEQEVHEKNGPWYVMRVRPYKTWDSKIDGAVISFQDIDELKRSVSITRNYADTLIQNAREGILILDANLRISAANPAFYNVFQLSSEQAEGVALGELAGRKWLPEELRSHLQELIHGDRRVDDLELRHEFPNIGARTMLFNARRIVPGRGQQMILLSVEDITEQKNQMEELRTQSELLELASDAVLVRDLAGTIQLWNQGAERIYGWNKREVLGKNIHELLQTEYPIPFEEIGQEILRSGYWAGELTHTRKDGEKRVVESRWSLDRGGHAPTILELNTDITNRRRYEDQLRKLSGRLMEIQDEERRRIARDLHDSTGQKLVGLKLSLSQKNADDRIPREQQIKLVDEILQEIRTVSQLLHPPLLEEAGLVSAIRWLVDGFGARAGIKVRLKVPQNIERLPDTIELALFRVIQEALNNIHRHSGAKSAEIAMDSSNGSLILKVSDGGRGSQSLSREGSAPLGVGILGMRERLSQLGGTLTIDSSSKGTTIRAEVPLVAQKAAS
jgi:two-component system, chemotaxis family, CheB/CheR fusion protein